MQEKKTTPYVIGQCWISDTELELGVGKVESIGQRQVSLFFLLQDETRTYAIQGAPLTRVLFETGDQLSFIYESSLIETDNLVSQQHIKKTLDISDVTSNLGLFSYSGEDENNNPLSIVESEIQPIIKINRPIERLFNAQIDQNKWFESRLASYRNLNQQTQSELSGLLGGRISLIAHQLYIIHEVASRYAPRVLLADEVGLGKTIEAGGIIHQQLYTGKVKRVLIVVPESLVHQWLVEMLRKFNLNFSLFDAERCDDEESSGLVDNPFDSSQLVICTLDFLLANPVRYQQCLATDWDLLVVDEAHHLQWSVKEVSQEYQSIEQLSQKIQAVLLLTATPEQLGKESHFARLRLLDPDRYQSFEKFINEEKDYQPLAEVIDNLNRLQFDESATPLISQLSPNEWKAIEKEIADQHQLEHLKSMEVFDGKAKQLVNELINQLLDYHGTGRVLFRNTRSSIVGFPKRQPLSHLLELPESYLFDNTTLESITSEKTLPEAQLMAEMMQEMLSPERGYQSKSDKTSLSQWTNIDPRVEYLLELFETYPNEKIVLITASAQTAKELHQHLKQKENKVCAVFHEGLSLLERDRAAAFFADKDSICQCLICSEIGSEGRNFQFSSHLVLFDIPLNPDLLEQRIGRLDRIGQKHDINIHIPYFAKSAQELLYRWNHEGLNSFNQSCPAAFQVFTQEKEKLSRLLLKTKLKENIKLKSKTHHDEILEEVEHFIDNTEQLTTQYNQQLEQGRDRLLEYNSCRKEIAESLVHQMQLAQRPEQLSAYLEQAFDCFGLENEEHKDKSFILRESDEMIHQFSLIGEEGLTYTFDRETALSNEDMLFITWEHPLVSEIMEKLISDDLGSTSMITFTDKQIAEGQLFLEALFVIDTPSIHNQESVLSQSYSETIMVDMQGKDVSNKLNSKIISETALNLDKQTVKGVIDGYGDELRKMQKALEFLMKKRLPSLAEQISSQIMAKIDKEIIRLEALKKINPMVRDIEIQLFKEKKIKLLEQFKTTNTHLDALRILISV